VIPLVAAVLATCGHMPQSHEALSLKCWSVTQDLICSRSETQHISDHDPALPIFWQKKYGEKIEDAKVDLADERTNGCDFPLDKK
jgi:hypothetical protein